MDKKTYSIISMRKRKKQKRKYEGKKWQKERKTADEAWLSKTKIRRKKKEKTDAERKQKASGNDFFGEKEEKIVKR